MSLSKYHTSSKLSFYMSHALYLHWLNVAISPYLMDYNTSKKVLYSLCLKENAQAEGVSAELGVASELAADLSCENRVPEMAESCEKVPRNSMRPHVDIVPGGNGTGTCLMRADT
jgi:hypothetical protein